ncbi:MAG: multidrug ABC transporter substrate-binding protein [candidate division Zixibacteria bacterium HGW-Zixibacteria-1]|nr:MAG: multidrug ABC transporter substrate-binding protein [candidate division Zixibacteria bacterium HGW-Zixibacteria-1]
MLVFENIKMALQSLRANPLRSILTLIGVAVGIAAVLYVVILGEITKANIAKQLESLGSNVLMIRPAHGHHRGIATSGNVINLTEADAEEIERVSEVITTTVPSFSGNAPVEYLDNNLSCRITGTIPEFKTVNNEKLTEGEFFNESHLAERSRVCVIGATIHQKLFGEQPAVGEAIYIRAKRFEVIGVLKAKGESWFSPDEQVFVPMTTAQERLFGVDHLDQILAQLKDAGSYDEALFDIETILRRNHRLRPDQDNDFDVRRQDFFLSTIQETNVALANFIILIALVSLVVGGIGIANMMLVAVTERTREIGLRRAIGARRRVVIFQFLIEAAVLGIIGGLIGIAGGLGVNRAMMGEAMIIPWEWVIYSLVICTSIGVMAGLYPAYRAANVNVIDALRYE